MNVLYAAGAAAVLLIQGCSSMAPRSQTERSAEEALEFAREKFEEMRVKDEADREPATKIFPQPIVREAVVRERLGEAYEAEKKLAFDQYVAERSPRSSGGERKAPSVSLIATSLSSGEARESFSVNRSFRFVRLDAQDANSRSMSLVMAEPYRDLGQHFPFASERAGFSFMRFSLDDMGKRNRLELTRWWASSHAKYDPNHREENHGVGFKYYYAVSPDDRERWCFAGDRIRNTQDGIATSVGLCYQRQIFEVKGIKLWLGGQLAFVNYGIPARNGRPAQSVRGIIPIPAVSVEGPVTVTVGWIPIENVYIANSSVSASSLEDTLRKAENAAGGFLQLFYRW